MQEQEAYTLTYLVGRTKKGQPYLASHIDRSFLTGERMIDSSFASHINRERMKNNVYSRFLNNIAGENFTEYELNCYEMLFSESLEAQNERHRKAREYSRIRKMGNYYKSPRTCPEEEILQIGDKDNCPPVELFMECVEAYISRFRIRYGSNCILLDCGIHNDEATPHAHIRRVWVYESEDGLKVSQTQALKELKFATPNPDRTESRYNNPKMAFTAEDRQLWENVCRTHGIEIRDSMRDKNIPHLEKEAFIDMQIDEKEKHLESVLLEVKETEAKTEILENQVAELEHRKKEVEVQLLELDGRILSDSEIARIPYKTIIGGGVKMDRQDFNNLRYSLAHARGLEITAEVLEGRQLILEDEKKKQQKEIEKEWRRIEMRQAQIEEQREENFADSIPGRRLLNQAKAYRRMEEDGMVPNGYEVEPVRGFHKLSCSCRESEYELSH